MYLAVYVHVLTDYCHKYVHQLRERKKQQQQMHNWTCLIICCHLFNKKSEWCIIYGQNKIRRFKMCEIDDKIELKLIYEFLMFILYDGPAWWDKQKLHTPDKYCILFSLCSGFCFVLFFCFIPLQSIRYIRFIRSFLAEVWYENIIRWSLLMVKKAKHM